MIIWSGLGFLPIVFFIVFSVLLGAGHKGAADHDAKLAYALLLTGLVSGILGWWLGTRPARTFIDKATGRELAIRKRHSLFFIPMLYWGPIFVAFGGFMLFAHKH